MFRGKVFSGFLTTTILTTLFTFSCNLLKPDKQENETITTDTSTEKSSDRPDGWEFASHDKDAQADYNTLFPDDIVNRIDITISDSLWNVLMNDMTSLSGSFGASGTSVMGGISGNAQQTGLGDTSSGQIPQEFYDAAANKNYGDSCSCTMMGQTLNGVVDTTGGKAYCKPQTGTTGNPDTNGNNMGNTEFLSREPVFIPVTFEFNGKKWTNVGFRLKGNSSLISAWGQGVYKLPFRIKSDKFEEVYPEIKNQRIYGFQNLSLCNGYMDSTMVHEKVASELFRSNDVPSTKSTFVRLYIDCGQGKKYFGLYTMAEVPDAPFLEKWFGNKKGNLYKPDGTGAQFNTYDATSFEELNNNDISNSDITSLFTALHSDRTDAGSWRRNLESVFNVNLFIKWLAINSAIGNWDAYGSMAHNYYLYNDKKILSWIPWDLSLSFSESGGMVQNPGTGSTDNAIASLTHSNVDSNWPLIRYLLDDSVYNALYLDELNKFATNYFNTGIALSKIQAAHDLIVPYVTGSEAEQSGYTFVTTPASFESAFTSLSQFITKQSISISSLEGNSQ
jgi:spore coat protein H